MLIKYTGKYVNIYFDMKITFFPFSFSFGVFVTPGLMERELEGPSHRVVPLSVLGLPCLRTSSCGHWGQSLAGSSVLRDG